MSSEHFETKMDKKAYNISCVNGPYYTIYLMINITNSSSVLVMVAAGERNREVGGAEGGQI